MGDVWDRGETEGGERCEGTEPETDLQHVRGGLEGTAGAVMEKGGGEEGFLGKGIPLQIHRELHIGDWLRLEARTSPAVGVGVAEGISKMLPRDGGS